MRTITVSGKSIELDEEGFLVNRSDWNEEVAKELAKADGLELMPARWEIIDVIREYYRKQQFVLVPIDRNNLELTPDHWEVIRFMREYFEENQITPNGRQLTKMIAKKLGPEKGNNRYLYGLFPYGPVKQAGKYAGLPRPCGVP